jgi:dihydroorotate dehydrogenase (fumarate)
MKEEDLYLDFWGVKVIKVMNAAGTIRGPEELQELTICESVGPIVVGSYTKEPRTGNPGQVYWPDPLGRYSVNVNGLPNLGADWCKKSLPGMVKIAREPIYHPLIVSVAGFNPQEYAELADLALGAGAFGVELNLSCPNVYSADGQQKKIPCFYPNLTNEILTAVEKTIGRDAIVWVKISPCCDLQQKALLMKALSDNNLVGEIYFESVIYYSLEGMAEVLLDHKVVKAVVCVNTWPNILAVDETGKSRLTFAGGVGGLGGFVLKEIGLNQTRRLSQIFKDRIHKVDIIGCGGISNGQDVVDYLKAGAMAVQVATAFLEKGVRVFDDITWQLADLIDTSF